MYSPSVLLAICLLAGVIKTNGKTPELEVGKLRFSIVHFSDKYKAGGAPYLNFAKMQWNNPRNIQPSAVACQKQCLTLTACEYGTYIKGGQRRGECWLSSKKGDLNEPCGMPCVSFTKKTSLDPSKRGGRGGGGWSQNQEDDGSDDIYAKGAIVVGIMLGLGFMSMSAFSTNGGNYDSYSRVGIEKRNRSMAEEDSDALIRQTHSPLSMLDGQTEEELRGIEQYRV